MNYTYQTISKPVEDITFKEKGSKFIGFGFPVNDEEEVKVKLQELRERYSDATHHCYAYRLGIDGENYRANDDGEPSGSAGLPIYNQIVSKEITNILIVSVRYYGGTKLGVSGLIKAYKMSAQLVLGEVKVIKRHLQEKVQFDFGYEDQGAVMRNIDKFNAEVISTEFTDSCSVIVRVRKDDLNNFLSVFEPLYNVYISML